jgi:hypothetical protein
MFRSMMPQEISKRMTILPAAFVAAMMFAVLSANLPGAWPAEEVVAAPSTGRTEVSVFNPVVPNAPARAGYCWTSSIALHRAGAWRCTVGNAIQDPCFSTPEVSNAVICGANPVTSEAGFLMRLTKPLPAPEASSSTTVPWIVELAIGANQVPGPYAMPPPKTYCSPLTGTMPMVAGLAVPFVCWEAHVESKPKLGDTQIGLLGDFTPGPVWTVTEVNFVVNRRPGPNQPPFKLTGRKTIALEKIWQ